MARKFFYVCAGMFLLAVSFHFGFTTATAQAPGNPVVDVNGQSLVTSNGDFWEGHANTWRLTGNVFGGGTTQEIAGLSGPDAIMLNGDVYQEVGTASGGARSWVRVGNVFTGSRVPTQRATWGQVKARYALSQGTAEPEVDSR